MIYRLNKKHWMHRVSFHPCQKHFHNKNKWLSWWPYWYTVQSGHHDNYLFLSRKCFWQGWNETRCIQCFFISADISFHFFPSLHLRVCAKVLHPLPFFSKLNISTVNNTIYWEKSIYKTLFNKTKINMFSCRGGRSDVWSKTKSLFAMWRVVSLEMQDPVMRQFSFWSMMKRKCTNASHAYPHCLPFWAHVADSVYALQKKDCLFNKPVRNSFLLHTIRPDTSEQTSASFLAETSVRSPRKLVIFII